MSKEAVEWLREHARRCEQHGLTESWKSDDSHAPRNYEAELARRFADEIEQRFVLKALAELTSRPSSFPPTRVYAATGKLRRRRT